MLFTFFRYPNVNGETKMMRIIASIFDQQIEQMDKFFHTCRDLIGRHGVTLPMVKTTIDLKELFHMFGPFLAQEGPIVAGPRQGFDSYRSKKRAFCFQKIGNLFF